VKKKCKQKDNKEQVEKTIVDAEQYGKKKEP